MNLPSNRTLREYWEEVPVFYRHLIDRHGWKQQPMLELVQQLADHHIARHLFPSTSHEALGLSRFEFYEERLAAPMVYLRYVAERDAFEITFQLGQGHTTLIETARVIDEDQWRRINEWVSPAT